MEVKWSSPVEEGHPTKLSIIIYESNNPCDRLSVCQKADKTFYIFLLYQFFNVRPLVRPGVTLQPHFTASTPDCSPRRPTKCLEVKRRRATAITQTEGARWCEELRMEPTPHTTETDTSEHHFPHLESSPPQTLIPVIGRSLVSPLKSLIFRHCGLILAILPPNSLASVTGD